MAQFTLGVAPTAKRPFPTFSPSFAGTVTSSSSLFGGSITNPTYSFDKLSIFAAPKIQDAEDARKLTESRMKEINDAINNGWIDYFLSEISASANRGRGFALVSLRHHNIFGEELDFPSQEVYAELRRRGFTISVHDEEASVTISWGRPNKCK